MSDTLDAESKGVSPARGDFARRFRSRPTAVLAVFFLLGLVFVAVFAPVIAPYSPEAIDVSRRLTSPSSTHWLGTDDLGRDVLTRLIYSARTSLFAATVAVTVAVVVGAPLGLAAGYFGGILDSITSRTADILLGLPSLVLALGVIAALGPGLFNAMAAVGLVYSPRVFRILRGATLGVRQETFVDAAVTIGASKFRIIRTHVLPNVRSPLIVEISLLMALSLLAEASLSFLGLGIVPPDTSWGLMLGRAFVHVQTAPLLIYWPGIAIVLTTLAFNAVGDGIGDALGREVRREARE